MVDENIYITGHLHPDTDSVAAAIGYAFFKRAKGEKAIACRLGKLNGETKYLLNRFQFEEPMLLEDARKTLGEIELDEPIAIKKGSSILDTIQLMQGGTRPSLAVVDEDNKILGLVSKSDLAHLGLGDTSLGIDLLKKTPVSYICKAINGKIVYDDENVNLNGKASIVAMTKERIEKYDIENRIVIVGDDSDAQKRLIEKGAGLLIVVWCDGVSDEVIETAKKNHCPIIISGHGSMNTSRFIYFAPPVEFVMSKNPVIFNTSDLVENASRTMMKSRYRGYPVVDDEGRLAGYVSRYHVLNASNKKIIMVDHNEFSQSVRAIEKAQILEVIDHHRINDFKTTQPVSFRSEIVGSTATIVATIFRENQIPIPSNLAGLLLGAILSDTLLFQSPTTTTRDKETANILAALANLDIDTFGKEMFSWQKEAGSQSIVDMVNTDIKYFDINNFRTMISQVVTPSIDDIKKREGEIEEVLAKLAKEKELDLVVVAFTSVIENGSVFYGAGEQVDAIIDAFPDKEGSHSIQKGILSRKSQILPMLSEAMARRN